MRWRGLSNCSPGQLATRQAARAAPARSIPGACPRSSQAPDATSTCSTCRRREGSAGIGIDATEAEAMRSELNRLNDAHRRTLDQLATGVAIFTADQRLTFYNAAYRSLWELDAGFLDQNPTDSAVLDQLACGAEAARGEGLPRVEGRPARGLSRTGGAGARLASARRSHHARRHDAEPAGRRDLSVRGRHRAAGHGPPLRRPDPRPERDARQPRRSGRGVRQRRPPAAAQSGLRRHVAARAAGADRAAAHRDA